MADYWGIREGIVEAIRSHPDLATMRAVYDPADMPAPEELPAVLVMMTERSSPMDAQRITAGQKTWHRCVFSVWVLHYDVASMADAVRRRDAVLDKVEAALMRDRGLKGRLERSLTIEAGEVMVGSSAKGTGFAAAIETLVVVELSVTV